MKRVASVYNLIFNIVLFVLGILLIIFTKQIFVNVGESQEFSDDSGAMFLLILLGSFVILVMYFIGALLSGLSFFTLIIMLITFIMNKKINRGIYIHNLVIYCIYLFNILFLFGSIIFESENILLSLTAVLLLASPFSIGVILNAVGIAECSKEKKTLTQENLISG